jgi:hypothetical protein
MNEVDRIAIKRSIPQAQVLRMLLEVGVECHKDMERVGLVGVVDYAYFVKESIKAKIAGRQLNII